MHKNNNTQLSQYLIYTLIHKYKAKFKANFNNFIDYNLAIVSQAYFWIKTIIDF